MAHQKDHAHFKHVAHPNALARSSRLGIAAGRVLGLAGLVLCGWSVALAQDFERQPILYSQATPHNPAEELQAKLVSGESALTHEPHFGYLRSVLANLDISTSSQVLVFSKTSLQREHIAPRTPRAIYFNDDMYIGFCQGGEVMEVAAVDPQLGTVFYTVNQDASAPPAITRQGENCLICHASSQTEEVPGHVMRSVFADSRGLPILASGTYRVDHTTPFEKRFGGWYVTGTHGSQKHLGNLISRESRTPETVDNSAGCNLVDLSQKFNTSKYLTPHSDLVALLVLAHQLKGHTLIAKANLQTRLALHQETELNRELEQSSEHRWASTASRIKSVAEPLTQYLLFAEEAPLAEPVQGTTTFADEFAARGPFVSQGRSLRQLDLRTRLFKYPVSYLIYTSAFDALPDEARDYVYRRMWEVLSGQDNSKQFAHLTPELRQEILEILRATKPGLPDYYKG